MSLHLHVHACAVLACRYRLWIMAWKAWTVYTHDRQEKKRKVVRSQNFACNRLLKRAWLCWKKYVEKRKESKMKWCLSVQWHLDAVQKRHWLQWKQAFSLHLHNQAMDSIALHYWASSLQRKVSIVPVTCLSCDQ